jgi:predicted NACHT family NTPase
MVKRSLQASVAGIQQAKRAFALTGWTQENLAGEANLKTRQPIWRFFTGKPVDRQVFIGICSILDLDWRAIADNPPLEFQEPGLLSEPDPEDLELLVQQVRSRYHDTIQAQCGILQLLDINRPVNIQDIYVDVNILEDIASQQYFAIESLRNIEPADFDRIGLGLVEHQQVPGMQAVSRYSKLRVLGRPGVGKTTFLQHLAIQCNRGEFAADRVPIFVVLREFAGEFRLGRALSLFQYLFDRLMTAGIIQAMTLETLLREGRILLLLDGMDEVLNQDVTPVLREIRQFSEQYTKNQFVASCRTAAQKLQLRGFTDVEIAPFTSEQINTFAGKWFVTLANTSTQSGYDQSAQFMEKLDLPENAQFRQLVVTPLFLHLACWVFQGQGKFPTKPTDFYKQGLDFLLGKWDEARGVERDDVYKGFLVPQKLRLMSQLAAVTFEQGQYFFEQHMIEQYIGDYLQDLPGAHLDPEELQLESEAMLRSIEAQHGFLIERARGIFSFSYLVFQEYFTARKIVANHNLQALEQALGGLVSHLTDPHWREVFLLTTAMLRSADSLVQLMKQRIDALVAQDPYLQEFLSWANQKSQQFPDESTVAADVKAKVKADMTTTRSLYLSLAKNPHMAAHFALACALDQEIFLDAALENLLLECTTDQANANANANANACSSALSTMLMMVLDAGFYKSLQQLKEQIPPESQTQDEVRLWWETNYSVWIDHLRDTIGHYRNLHHSWTFSPEQQQILQRYYEANQLLIDCLNSNCEVTTATRQDIEATLLLPQKDLEDHEWQGK